MAGDTPPELACLLGAAWQLPPEQRPTAAQLEAKLQVVAEQLENSSLRRKALAEQAGTAAGRVAADERGVVSLAQFHALAVLSHLLPR